MAQLSDEIAGNPYLLSTATVTPVDVNPISESNTDRRSIRLEKSDYSSSSDDSDGYATPTETDWSDYHWWNYGSKKLKTNAAGSVTRKYYSCPGLGSERPECPAKMHVDYRR
jgi:hypothetical protein